MKRILLIFGLSANILSANAQLTLTGTSYTQNFDGLPTYPTGWNTYNHATATSLGSVEAIQYFGSSIPSTYFADSSSCIGSVHVGGFKNFPSATVLSLSDDMCATTPPTFTNRALGVRQVDSANGTHPKLDPGASFVLKIANTTGFSNFHLTFKLQSLDTMSTRTTTWTVDYGIGASPTSFTPATATGIMTTGNHVYSNNTITVNFGTALDNKSGPVYIRVAALAYTSGSGNRASTAIDDFNLTWSSTSGISNITGQPQVGLTVLGNATSDKVTFGYNLDENADYAFSIYDITGRVLHSQHINAKTGDQQIAISNMHLTPGMYFAKMYNSNSSSVAKIMIQ
jgi:Secretion system C-terminal sorting domain